MRLLLLSDTHMQHQGIKLPEADVLIHAGDACSRGTHVEWRSFCGWWNTLEYRHKVFVAGNHDWPLEHDLEAPHLLEGHYLEDSGVQIEGLNFYGSPWQPPFNNWAFNLGAQGREARFAQIPSTVDVLVTHAPPRGIQDSIPSVGGLGCEFLRLELDTRLAPKLHVFGHIHAGFGVKLVTGPNGFPRLSVNAAQVDEKYRRVNGPLVVEI